MCGIAGYWDTGGAAERHVLKALSDQLAHRGPDAFGYHLDGPIALGHRRLSIIDVAGGDQPIGNEDGRLQVVFNGEIYNYRELRQDLLQKGHRFATHSDTEVLVHLYEEVGERLPEFLNGMFAFAIWDKSERAIFLARDRMGKKPLYYSFGIAGTRFCFASELKALTVLPGFDAEVNYRAAADFLSFSYVPDPDSIYENVFKLQPGCSLRVTETGQRFRRYWAPQWSVDESAGFDDTVERIRALSGDAIQRRMISDVPLGAFLSGGVDSSSVVALMASAGSEVRSFSIGFTNKEFDERRFARSVVERYHTQHAEEVVTPSVLEILNTLVTYYDEPFGDSSAIPTLYLSRLTRQHVTVALSGDGADEVFGGYGRYGYCAFDQRLAALIPDWFRKSVLPIGAEYYPAFHRMPRPLRAKSLLTRLSQELGTNYFKWMSAVSSQELSLICSDDMRQALAGYSPLERFQDRFTALKDLSPLQQMQAVDLETYLPGDILVKVDRASMAYSLEARCPWLDYRMVELANSLPPQFKLHAGNGKYIFKEAMRPYLPEGIIRRSKMGFAVPVAEWLRTSLRQVFERAVFQPDMRRYLDLNHMRKIWMEHQRKSRDHGPTLWNILMLALWDAKHRSSRSTSYELEAQVPVKTLGDGSLGCLNR
jgi:asparagine synthase (glutamine-hydrolysing)